VDGDALMIADGKITLEKLETGKLTRVFKDNMEKNKDGVLLMQLCAKTPQFKEAFEARNKAMQFIAHAFRDLAIDVGYSPRDVRPSYLGGPDYGEMMAST